MTQEPYQQIYEKKYFIQKLFTQMCSLCTKYKRILLLVSTFLERCFNLGPFPGLGCQLPWGCLWAAASEGGAFSDHSQLCNCEEALFQVPPPSRAERHQLLPLSPPDSTGAHQVAGAASCCRFFPGEGINPASPGPLSPSPNFFHSEQGWRQRGKERRLGPDGGNGIGVREMKSTNVGSSIIDMKPETPGWGPRGQGTAGPRQKTPFCGV